MWLFCYPNNRANDIKEEDIKYSDKMVVEEYVFRGTYFGAWHAKRWEEPRDLLLYDSKAPDSIANSLPIKIHLRVNSSTLELHQRSVSHRFLFCSSVQSAKEETGLVLSIEMHGGLDVRCDRRRHRLVAIHVLNTGFCHILKVRNKSVAKRVVNVVRQAESMHLSEQLQLVLKVPYNSASTPEREQVEKDLLKSELRPVLQNHNSYDGYDAMTTIAARDQAESFSRVTSDNEIIKRKSEEVLWLPHNLCLNDTFSAPLLVHFDSESLHVEAEIFDTKNALLSKESCL